MYEIFTFVFLYTPTYKKYIDTLDIDNSNKLLFTRKYCIIHYIHQQNLVKL